MEQKTTTSLWYFLGAWFCLNLLQSFATELGHDEAYYWVYSQHPAWGYFDHPPMIAWWITLGDSLLHNELGVRFWTVTFSTLSLYLLYQLAQPKREGVFFSLCFSALVLHIACFIVTPDSPLLFFTVVFFYFFKKYVEKDSFLLALILGITIAALGYSKYQGAIILLGAFLSNWQLLRRGSFWCIPLVTLCLFFPHLHWQYQHDFPTFRYHLVDRHNTPWTWINPINFVFGTLLIFGPLTSILLFWGAARRVVTTAFEKALKGSLLGILILFGVASFRSQVEANWLAAGIVPAILLATQTIENNERATTWLYRLAWVNLGLILLVRLWLITDFLPQGWVGRNEFHGWREWAQQISERAGDRPVIFKDDYQYAAKYSFYAQKPVLSLSDATYSGSAYDFFSEDEARFQHKPALLFWKDYYGIDFENHLPSVGYTIVDSFQSFNQLKINVLESNPSDYRLGDSVQFTVAFSNPTTDTLFFAQDVNLNIMVFNYKKSVQEETILAPLSFSSLAPHQALILKLPFFKFNAYSETGKYRFRFALKNKWYIGKNSNFMPLKNL